MNQFIVLPLTLAAALTACGDETGPGEFRADFKTSDDFFTQMSARVAGSAPHGAQQTWYSTNLRDLVTESSFTAPEGSVAIKEFDSDQDGNPDGLAVMIKRESGFDPDNGDWYYEMRDLNGQVRAMPAAGANPMCYSCHVGASATDYLAATKIR